MTPLTHTQDSTGDLAGPWSAVSCTDAELAARIQELEKEMRVLLWEQLQYIAEADHRAIHTDTTARSLPVWLQGLLNIDARDAKTRVTVARNVEDRRSLYGETMPPDMPDTAAALAEGAIGLDHARVIVNGIRRLPDYARCHQINEVEATLAGYARTMSPRELEKLAERIRYLLDQDGAYRNEEAQHETRELHYATTRDGMTVIKAKLDRETGAKFAALMQPLAAPRPEIGGEKDPRTTGQRNADGFAALLDLALDHDGTPRTGGQRPQMTIAIDFDDLKQGLGFVNEDGMPGTLNTERAITAQNARRIACDAEILPMVLDGDSLPLDVGRAKRTAPTHIRAALLRRDGVCAFPGCDRPPGTPEAHHIQHWVDGGATDLDNLVMLCAHHHRTLHNQRWDITMRDGRPEFIPPPTVDPRRTPRRGGTALPARHRAIVDQHLASSRGHASAPSG
ncbi:HNH endonuclease signature motif containing protein [Saccharopolyspora shandongensis]|uniref:HNH endonuclease signature motif containing protein n=1 Tax=Saccharopolyspora shandongensis TaxID=418495 RepID=UPI00340FAF4C